MRVRGMRSAKTKSRSIKWRVLMCLAVFISISVSIIMFARRRPSRKVTTFSLPVTHHHKMHEVHMTEPVPKDLSLHLSSSPVIDPALVVDLPPVAAPSPAVAAPAATLVTHQVATAFTPSANNVGSSSVVPAGAASIVAPVAAAAAAPSLVASPPMDGALLAPSAALDQDLLLAPDHRRLVPGSPTVPSPLDEIKATDVELPMLPDEFVLPSGRTVAQNEAHKKEVCAKFMGQKWKEAASYQMWQQGFSQFGQDKFLWDMVFGRRRNGIFVDVGAYDGETHSNSAILEFCFGWTGILVEANPGLIDLIKKWRQNIILYNAACNDVNSMCQFMVKQDAELSGLVDKSKAHFAEGDKVVDIPCLRLGDIFKRHKVTHINYLSVDTEGVELMVLDTIDYDAVQIDVIGMEANGHENQLKEFLSSKGFAHHTTVGEDMIFVHRSFKPTPVSQVAIAINPPANDVGSSSVVLAVAVNAVPVAAVSNVAPVAVIGAVPIAAVSAVAPVAAVSAVPAAAVSAVAPVAATSAVRVAAAGVEAPVAGAVAPVAATSVVAPVATAAAALPATQVATAITPPANDVVSSSVVPAGAASAVPVAAVSAVAPVAATSVVPIAAVSAVAQVAATSAVPVAAAGVQAPVAGAEAPVAATSVVAPVAAAAAALPATQVSTAITLPAL